MYYLFQALITYILSSLLIVVNYDADNGWTTMLDKFSNVPKIADDVRLFYKELNEAKIALTDTDKLLGFANGLKINNKEFLSFLNNTEYSEKSLVNYQKHLQSATTATTKFAATLKTVAANMAIMLAVTAGIKGIAWVIDQVVVTTAELEEAARNSAEELRKVPKYSVEFINI